MRKLGNFFKKYGWMIWLSGALSICYDTGLEEWKFWVVLIPVGILESWKSNG